MRTLPCAALLALLAAPGFCATSVPKVDGEAVAEDPYVKEYRETMTAVESQINAIKAAIKAMPPSVGRAAGFADEAKLLAMYAPMAGLMAKAEGAHMRMLKHILGAEKSMDKDFDAILGLPPFESKVDDPSLRPKEDDTLKGEPGEESPEDQPTASPGTLETLRSQYSGPQVGTGFGGTLAGAKKAVAGAQASGKAPDVDDLVSSLRDRMRQRQRAAERLAEEAQKTVRP